PHGASLALGQVAYSVLATFVTLYYLSRHWNGAALCLTAFGLTLIAARLGFSLVFPAIGVEAVQRVPEFNRGTALGVYTAFADVSFFLVGPVAGALIGLYGYGSIFLFALISILAALAI